MRGRPRRHVEVTEHKQAGYPGFLIQGFRPKTTGRPISPLRPHNLRHTFAFALARETNADPYELERRLGHRSQKYIQRYTNPPEEVAAGYVEKL